MTDKQTSCMEKAGYLAFVDCTLHEAMDNARAGHRTKTLMYLNRTRDAARSGKLAAAKTAVESAIKTAANPKSSKKDLVKAIKTAGKVCLDVARITFRKCGAKVSF